LFIDKDSEWLSVMQNGMIVGMHFGGLLCAVLNIVFNDFNQLFFVKTFSIINKSTFSI